MTKKRKALYISYDGMTDPLGESQVIPYVKGLSKKGVEFTILSYEKKDRFQANKSRIAESLMEDNIKWIHLRYYQRMSHFATIYDLIRGFIVVKYLVLFKGVRLLHCRSYIASILGVASKKLLRTKFIFDMRGFWADERVEGGIINKGRVYRTFKKLEIIFLKNAHATISLTQNAIDEMNTWPQVTPEISKTMHHITTCCDIDKYSRTYVERLNKPFDKNKIEFVYIGSVGPWHSEDRIKEFIVAALKRYPNCFFNLIVSNGREIIEQFLLEKGVPKKQYKLRPLPHNKVPEEIASGDIGFFFIPPVYAKKSSSPTKMGEMLSAGIPIITGHSIGDVDRLIDDNNIGYVMKEFTEEEYNRALLKTVNLVENDKKVLAESCKAVALDYFSLEKGINKYFSIYTSLI